ncbi:MAG: NAD-dependent epimerase/dehydratase family protein [Nitrospirae bacterium]|nr:NAD-dependent epimerase/dehydratase family protein [Nitrospirota bacterium]
MRGKRVLVTGGAGFIGSNLVDELARGNRVIVIDNFSSGKLGNIRHLSDKGAIGIVTGDIRDKVLCRTVTRDVDVIYHLAVQCLRVSISDPEINHEVNATGTLNLLMAARENSVGRFVYVSSSEVYGTALRVPMDEQHPNEPTTVYGASKLAGEKYTLAYHRTYGMSTMVVIPFNTYGPREHFEGAQGEVIPKFVLRALNNEPPHIFGDGAQTRDFTYVSDTVRGIMMASECDMMIGQTVNIARGEEVSIRSIAEKIYRKLGKGHISPVMETARPGDVRRHFAGVEKAEKLFGFRAEVSIDDGLDRYIEWFKTRGYDFGALMKEDVVFNWEQK